ncbi:MAG: retroviral-like aspartic protease family protein [Myxococcales bacterium]|nr:retroviral-like aspartic protease family protein [Myxococcales bacterium]
MHSHGSASSTIKSVLVALAWLLLGLGSLASLVVAVWIAVSMGQAAADGRTGLAASPVFVWLVALVMTVGVPFAIAVWKHQGDARRISLTMAWLPMLWNVGGLLVAVQLMPDIVASALRGHGAWIVQGHFGDSHSATRVMSALGHRVADVATPASDTLGLDSRGLLPQADRGEVEPDKALSVPMAEGGTAILMDVTLQGPKAELTLPYLFDTGASYTTISGKTAKALGIDVPEDAPTLTFNTASGPRESRMVHLPALQLGQVRIPGLLVSVCDACVNERTEGLLGLNVMREFFVQMDHKNQRMQLLPRVAEPHPNRAYDVEPVVELKVEGAAEVWLGRVRWVVLVRNRGTVPLRDVVPVVKFTDGPVLRGASIAEVAPGKVGRSLVEGKASLEGSADTKGHYTLGLAEAYW